MILTGFFCALACALAPGEFAVVGDTVVTNGAIVGRYSDNEAPDQAADLFAAPGLRLAGVGPYGPLPFIFGAIRLREFYPVGVGDWRPRRGDGYILQGTFHWPGRRAPTYRDRRRMWCAVKRRRPLMVLWYGWSVRVAAQARRIARSRC